ncbi:MAG: 4Fe-4S binding protein [Candidatus Sericytochromatia bacterium]
MDRFELMNSLLEKSKFFKLVCGAGNEDCEEVKKLTIIYTLAGTSGLDISATPSVVLACMEGIEQSHFYAKKLDIKIPFNPFITVSVGMPGDHHVRKAFIDLEKCVTCNLCIPVCPTDAIPNDLVIKQEKCIGCGNCSAICHFDSIFYKHNNKNLEELLPKCLSLGAEQIELHAGIKEDDFIFKEWELINKINAKNHVSMCLDRQHLSDFDLEKRIKKAKEISGDRLIIQADGIPMSGGEDDFNTTLQAVSIADIVNKRFNKKIDKKTKKSIYKDKNEINILLSGGTNSLTSKLAKQNDVRFQGISIGTFARKIVKEYISNNNFYNDNDLIYKAVLKAKELLSSCGINNDI